MGDSFDLEPLCSTGARPSRRSPTSSAGSPQYLKDCICDHLLVDCPPRLEEKDLDLAAVSIRGGSVYKVCNFSRRRYVKSFPTVGYWLSLVPVLPAFREAIGRFCCAVFPEVFGRYSSSGHDEANDRMGATTMLRFIEVAQGEDPMTRLRNLDLGFLPSFLEGANSGDWDEEEGEGEGFDRVAEPVTDDGAVTVRHDGEGVVTEPVRVDVRKARAPETVFRNLLRNPVVRRDLSREALVAPGEDGGVVAEGTRLSRAAQPGPTVDPAQIQALLSRVESLETELAALKKPARARTRKTTKPPE